MKTKYFIAILVFLATACEEKDILQVDTSENALNILKGTFDNVEYPEKYSFNAYFLGVGAEDYTLKIPVRLSGPIDYTADRIYEVRVNPDSSQHIGSGKEYTLNNQQILHKGRTEDSIFLTIHIAALNETDDYKIYLELVPNENFIAGVKEFQFIEIEFMKNVNTAPAFWTNNSKLKKFTYHPRKGAKFLEISKITDPEWTDAGNSIILDYWIKVATQWFEDHEEYDEKGERIYFDE